MIKRWTIHIEAHWGYWPRFSIRRQVGHGERHVDGGVPGTLVVCKTCSGQGVLHQPDSFAGLWPNPPGPITNAPSFLKYYMDDYTCEYEIGETVHTRGRDYVVRSIGHDTDFKKAFIILERKDNSPHIPPPMSKNGLVETDIVSIGWEPSLDDPQRIKMELGANSMHYQVGEEVMFQGEKLVVEDVVTQVIFLRKA